MKGPRFEVFRSTGGPPGQSWRWRVVGRNGRVVAASSEGFARRTGAWTNARLVRWMLADLVS